MFYEEKKKKVEFVKIINSNFVGDHDDRKSTCRYIFMMGSRVVLWSSKKQPIVTLPIKEIELVAATACACLRCSVEKNSWRTILQARRSYYNFFMITI